MQIPLRSKLVLAAVAGVLLVMVLATSITITTQILVQEELTHKQATEITKSYANKFDGDMRSDLAIARSISLTLGEYNSSDRDEIDRVLHSILENNPHLLGTYVCYEPNAFDGRDNEFASIEGYDREGRFATYWNKINGNIQKDHLIDCESYDYYIYPKVFKDDIISDPYYYEGVFIISYSSPIIKDGEFIGIAGVDVSLDYMDEIVSQVTAFDTGYAIMTGSSGLILSQPYNKDWIGNKTIYDYENEGFSKAADDIKYKKSGYVNTIDPVTGKEVVVFYEPIESKNYGFFLIIPKDEMLEGTFALRDKLIGIGILSIFFTSIAAYLTSRTVTGSIDDIVNDFKEMADSIADGELNIRANTNIDEDFKKIPDGLNNILDGVVVPIHETTRVAVELSKGHLDARFEGDTEGEFKQLAQSINYFAKLLDVIITESNEVLVAMEKEDFSRRVHFHGHGDLKVLTEGIDQTRLALQQASIDRQIAEQELKEYARKLEQSNELKDMFTDIMRHDLLNPASVIKGFTELLLMTEEDDQTKRLLGRILDSNNNLIEMIQSAAEFAKVESSDELELKVQDITSIIEHSIDILTTQAGNKEIVIEFNEKKPHHVLANPIIETVFTNLISNAIKYSPEKTEVIVEIKESDDLTEITITDFGEGIKDEHKTTVFDRFKRVNKTGVRGSGLGLAIVKRTIELHEGDVGVRDNPSGKGSVFFVKLKRYDDEHEEHRDKTAKTY
ncbi:HAMP domain-containing protein [Methanococcoides orientis]|uniref:ATP-binding protein n=1 Tax=Methanococcoides orientis TaxID=2822137 RepID=UPI001E3323DE|nr:ATP-binding protein [Methanococcoides orientis]UGV39755.1 HAMP domain-containing protein [Methanococcoides orientis]